MAARSTTLLRNSWALIAGTAFLFSGVLIYLFISDAHNASAYGGDRIDLTLHFPFMPTVFRPSSTSSSFDGWDRPELPDYCAPRSPADFWAAKYTEQNLDMSKAYGGSATRFRRVVQKAMSGESVKMAVIGGSGASSQWLANVVQNGTASFSSTGTPPSSLIAKTRSKMAPALGRIPSTSACASWSTSLPMWISCLSS